MIDELLNELNQKEYDVLIQQIGDCLQVMCLYPSDVKMLDQFRCLLNTYIDEAIELKTKLNKQK